MPRGFLVKRLQKHPHPPSYRVRRYSDEDRSDSSSDHDAPDRGLPEPDHPMVKRKPLGTPDSGFDSPPGVLLAPFRNPELKLYYSTMAPTVGLPANNNDSMDVPLALTTRHHTNTPPFTSSSLPTNLSLPCMDRLTVSPALSMGLHTPTKLSPCIPLEAHRPHHRYQQYPSKPDPTPPQKKRMASSEGALELGCKVKSPKKPKAVRRLNFDEDKSSPVSGTIIRELDSDEEPLVIRKGDIDPSFNVVEVTEEAKAEIAKIENKIGDYICQLCKEVYDDAFGLAQHRCSRIVHVEYRCPECDKVFNCPANLASHRRWHKPRPPNGAASSACSTKGLAPASCTPGALLQEVQPELSSDNDSSHRGTPSPEVGGGPSATSGQEEGQFECHQCAKRFRRQAYLRKHMQSHAGELLRLLSTINSRATSGARDQASSHLNLCNSPSPVSALSSRSSSPEVEASFAAAFQRDFNGNNGGDSSLHQVTLGGNHNGNHEVFTCKFCPNSFCSSLGLTRHVSAYHPSDSRQVLMLHSPTVKASH